VPHASVVLVTLTAGENPLPSLSSPRSSLPRSLPTLPSLPLEVGPVAARGAGGAHKLPPAGPQEPATKLILVHFGHKFASF